MLKRNPEPVSEQHTAPLPSVQASALTFSAYLKHHNLTCIGVARAAGVPAVTVWSIEHGRMVSPTHAQQVRQGLYQLTGVPYQGPIPTIPTRKER